jgi:hypothetical protein
LSLKNSNFPFPHLLEKLTPTPPEICLTKNQNAEEWDSWGVRDVAILSDEAGFFLSSSDEMFMYYTGSCKEGSLQQTGRAISRNQGKDWYKSPLNPVLETSKNEWDSEVSATPWVIELDKTFYLYYRGSSNACFSDAIGLAISKDGINFQKYENNPIIKAEDFVGIRAKPSCMGVLNAVQDYDGNLIVLFEAVEEYHQQRGQVFAARSSDGIKFFPMNKGMPIFSSRDVGSWPVVGVCNPRLTRLGDGWFMLGFNGTYSGEWSIGIAFTRNFKDWHEHPSNPIIVPRGWPCNDPLTGRIEGPCFDIRSIKEKAKKIKFYFMAIPFGAENHNDAVVAKSNLNLSSNNQCPKYDFVGLPSIKESFQLLNDGFILNANLENSKFLQVHYISYDFIHGISLDFNFNSSDFSSKKAYIVFSNTLNSLPRGIGTAIRITDKSVDLREHSQFPHGQEHAPLKHWIPIISFPQIIAKISLSVAFSKSTIEISIQSNGKDFLYKKSISNEKYRILTCACFMADAAFKFKEIA